MPLEWMKKVSHFDVNTLVSAVFGGGIAGTIVKAFVGKSFRDLEKIAEKVDNINNHLSAISTTLKQHEKMTAMIPKHDSRIAVLEERVKKKR